MDVVDFKETCFSLKTDFFTRCAQEPRDAEINRKVKARLDSAKKWQQMGYLAVLFILVLILVVQIIQLVIKSGQI